MTAQPISATTLVKPAPRLSRPRERRIVIWEQPPQKQQKQPEAEASDKDEDTKIRRKGKKPLKKALVQPSSESTPSPA